MEGEKDYQQLIGEVIQHIDLKAVETQRHFDIVAEDLRDDIKLLAEGLVANNERLDKVQKDVSGIKETVSIMQVDMAILKTAVKITQNSIDAIKADTEFIKSDSMQKVSREEFSTLEKRVILLENKFASA